MHFSSHLAIAGLIAVGSKIAHVVFGTPNLDVPQTMAIVGASTIPDLGDFAIQTHLVKKTGYWQYTRDKTGKEKVNKYLLPFHKHLLTLPFITTSLYLFNHSIFIIFLEGLFFSLVAPSLMWPVVIAHSIHILIDIPSHKGVWRIRLFWPFSVDPINPFLKRKLGTYLRDWHEWKYSDQIIEASWLIACIAYPIIVFF